MVQKTECDFCSKTISISKEMKTLSIWVNEGMQTEWDICSKCESKFDKWIIKTKMKQ